MLWEMQIKLGFVICFSQLRNIWRSWSLSMFTTCIRNFRRWSADAMICWFPADNVCDKEKTTLEDILLKQPITLQKTSRVLHDKKWSRSKVPSCPRYFSELRESLSCDPRSFNWTIWPIRATRSADWSESKTLSNINTHTFPQGLAVKAQRRPR